VIERSGASSSPSSAAWLPGEAVPLSSFIDYDKRPFVSGCCGGWSPGSTVSMLGPTIPPMLLARAGEVINASL
jgi:hypothetical protein